MFGARQSSPHRQGLPHTDPKPGARHPRRGGARSRLERGKLRDAPLFAAIAGDLVAFVGDSQLVIHNAEFDLKFLNAEFARAGRERWTSERAIDTIALAKRKFPGARYSLDELCRRFNIDLSVRSKHGARIDAELLAEVYLELGSGDGEAKLSLGLNDGLTAIQLAPSRVRAARPEPLAPRLTPEEQESHARFVAGELSGDIICELWPKIEIAKAN